jgi:hypothetical protein
MRYAKSILMVAGTVVSAIIAAMTTSGGHVTPDQWIKVAIAGITACAVFYAPNVPGARYTKMVMAILGAVLTYVETIIAGMNCATFAACHIGLADWLQCFVITVSVLGVYQVPNSTNEVRSANL